MLLSADLWVGALLRRVELAGSFAYVARKGDARYGSVLVKVMNLRTREAFVLREATKGEETVWMRPVSGVKGGSLNETDIDAYIARQVGNDPDLWVVEIEDVEGRHFLTETVEIS